LSLLDGIVDMQIDTRLKSIDTRRSSVRGNDGFCWG
jgi:hypothetical protein